MPQIPTYTAERPLDTDRGGRPTARVNNAMGSALQRLGRSVGGMHPQQGSDRTQLKLDAERHLELASKRQAFDRIRVLHDTTAGLEQELESYKGKIPDDGAGFFRAFVDNAVRPAIERAVSSRPQNEQAEIRLELEHELEPVVEAAALIERDQSVRHFLAETDRIAGHIARDMEAVPESFERAKTQLDALLEASPIPESLKPAKALEQEQKLARRLAQLMLDADPVLLAEGALGWTRSAKSAVKNASRQFKSLPEAERRNLFDRAVDELEAQK